MYKKKLQNEVENLYDHLLKEQARNRDLTIKIVALEKQIEISDSKDKENKKNMELLDTSIKQKIVAFNEDQKKIMESIKSIKKTGITSGGKVYSRTLLIV